MNMTIKTIEAMSHVVAMKQALDALEKCSAQLARLGYSANHADQVIPALRTAIAEAESRATEQAEKQQPVAWMDGYCNIYSLEEKAAGCEDAVIPLVPAIQHWSDCAVHNEPAYPKGDCDCGGYTTPPAAQPAPTVQEPVAIVSGYYGGQCVVLPTNPARLFNSGTAFYTTPPNVATPLAAPVQEPPDDELTQALIERDEAENTADELAQAIAQITGEDIGEHTSANFPWRNALDAAENWLCHPPAAQRQWVGLTDEDRKILEAVRREMDEDDDGNAPGHGHRIPGIWDEDNGDLAGKPCAWCLTWAKFTALIERENNGGAA